MPDQSAACAHKNVSRLSPLYIDGRPLYKCDACGVRFTYEDAEASFKVLVPLGVDPYEWSESDA